MVATLGVVGEHWNTLIIRDALFGVCRFHEFHKRLGIARNVLSTGLKQLVDEGILAKRNGEGGFPEYRLTEQGIALQPIQQLAPRSSRGELLSPRDLRVKPGPALDTTGVRS